jgi:hypothetical protein
MNGDPNSAFCPKAEYFEEYAPGDEGFFQQEFFAFQICL